MIVHEHHETGGRERLSEALQAVLFHTRIAMSHRDSRIPLQRRGGREQPTAQAVTALNLEFNVAWLDHDSFLTKVTVRCSGLSIEPLPDVLHRILVEALV